MPQVQLVPGAGRGDQFAYDPDWDDDWEIDRSLLDDEDEDEDDAGGEVKVDAVALSIVPASDDEVTAITKSWVQAGARARAGLGGGGRGRPPSLREVPSVG